VALALLAACAPLGAVQERSAVETGVMTRVRAGSRMSYTAQLSIGTTEDDGAAQPAPSGTMRLAMRVDDTFEYQLTLRDADHVAYVAGHLYRTGPDHASGPVATFFSDVVLNGRYVQLRGTGAIARTLKPSEVLEEVRSHPTSFEVRIEPRTGSRWRLSGVLR
jgi:hypothetical protein